MAASTVLVLVAINLIQSFTATPSNCKILQPKKIDLKSTTFSGKWYLLRWATQYKPYREEFGQVDNAYLVNSPVVQKNKMLMKGYMRIGDKCISEMEAYDLSRNGVDFTSEAMPFMMFRILDTKIQNSLLFYIEEKREGKMYHTLSLYGRKPTAMENELKIFEEQVQCAGMKTDRIIVLPQLKDECNPEDTVEALKLI
ncbi:lipocalin-like [Hypanus sabinus]|uniref:lipocalin-like n=1 Tax=Hypanus sabinus TaxID=79690 RepID=UPI0028C4E5DF|nr:lipocalin-like [Hypanus sabinus]